ncbi:hypothetical protein F2P81_007631 [Scophthalmus maximus]|uniref:HMG box domain-containing protein n=1 Tax=Scophthalmus maximus TaxID=52904 RepID=A0A6A4SVW7_SCOMX|nr:hypothetical protein F2P81_007631 [Scophthalmus maximus]
MSTPKKRKSKAQEDTLEKPKKPRSAFLLYYFDVHQTMQLEELNRPQSEINKRISESWKRLSVAEKAYYLEKAKSEKEGLDTSSLSPSKDLPGFRKILPRANYILLSKGCASNHQLGASQSEVSVESLDPPSQAGLPTVSLTQESKFTPLVLAGEVELSELPVAVDDIAEEKAAVSSPTALQGISPLSSSSSVSSEAPASTVVQGPTDLTANGVTLTGNDTSAAGSGYGWAMETTQLVAIIPTQRLVEAKAGVSSVGPVMMMSVGAKVEQSAKPSYKMDLGLSTARGRGRCKNPSCDYMYKNRHKPSVCPTCGCELTQKNTKGAKSEALLDPYQALSPAQKDMQRQNTLQLLRRFLQIPESETELQETLNLIQELNNLQIILVQPSHQEHEDGPGMETLVETGWPQFYESAATHCGLCNYPLFKGGQSTVAGQEDCWLLTETLIQTASLQLKVCLNVQCLALHSFTDLHPGLFNIGNKLLVSIDLFLKIRADIKLGHAPDQAARTILDHIPNHPVHSLSPEEFTQIQELLLSGYWAFECLTVRDYNDMICGICGVAPKMEIAQRFANNVLELKNVEFTWPEYSVSDEVLVDDFWLTMESEAIEQAAFPTDIPITRVDASIIAPFIPPLMRSPTVINTEKDKDSSHTQPPPGDSSTLVRLIHDGQLRLENIEDHSEDELRTILGGCGASVTSGSTKNELLASLISLYTLVHDGLSTAPQPPPHHTGGKLSKVCPHKVVCGSKYLVRGETARDHVDLLLSSRYWPPVYVSDCARQVALCTDMQYPELATQMWGRNQGCFCDPFEKPEFVSCAELQDQPYSADLSLVAENQQVHPITKSSSCWLVHPPGAERPPAPPAPEHHSMSLCRDLEPYVSLVAELEKEKQEEHEDEGAGVKERTDNAEEKCTDKSQDCSSGSSARCRPVVFSNTAYYYLYNRLVDFLTSRDIVSQQINQVVKACQPGEVVIRDALYRLGVAQINTEKEEEDGYGIEGQIQEERAETYEVVLPELEC